MEVFDVAVIGAGAAGMMCAAVAGRRGRRVVLLDQAESPGEKIRISGGGRCNFTNLRTSPANFISENPHFCRSALAGYSPADFVALIRRHAIAFHEKHLGQLFCDGSSLQIVQMLLDECSAAAVKWHLGRAIRGVRAEGGAYVVDVADGRVVARAVVIATGGLSIPKIGATDFGYRVARQFGLRVVEPRPGLVPLVCDEVAWKVFSQLSGISAPARVTWRDKRGGAQFDEDLLITHRGLSGPAALQISSYWRSGTPIAIDLMPDVDWDELIAKKGAHRGGVSAFLAARLPRRFADHLAQLLLPEPARLRPIADLPDRVLREVCKALSQWQVIPAGTEGFRKAEVTVGGVDTRDLSSQTLEARSVGGLYFIGEVVDVTGWLGGYNFQWAWASAAACARAL